MSATGEALAGCGLPRASRSAEREPVQAARALVDALGAHHTRLAAAAERELATGRATPFALFDLDRANENLLAFRRAAAMVGVVMRIGLPVKACPLVAVLAALADKIDHFDVQSAAEAKLCPPSAALAFHAAALELPSDLAPLRWLSLNSCAQWEQLRGLSCARDGSIRLGIRLAVDTAGAAQPFHGKFGVGGPQASLLLAELPGEPFVHWHCHRRLADPAHAAITAGRLARYAGRLAQDAGWTLRTINIGGGWDGAFELALRDVALETIVTNQLHAVRAQLPQLEEIIVEPGRAALDDAGVVVTRVLEAETHNPTHVIAVIDAPTSLLVPTSPASYRLLPLESRAGAWRTTTLADPHCRPSGVIATQQLPPLHAGDALLVTNTGAYTYSFASLFSGPLPPALALHDTTVQSLLDPATLSRAWQIATGQPAS